MVRCLLRQMTGYCQASMSGAIASASDALPGRTGELSAVESALSARSGRALLFEGPFGSGKSALLAAAARDARERGARVVGARGTEAARHHAFGIAATLTDSADIPA